jgi:hypothetical protein
MKLTAVTISMTPETWDLPEYNWFNYVENIPLPELTADELEYYDKDVAINRLGLVKWVTYLGKKRNHAIGLALEKFPETTDIMICDSRYVHQVDSVQQLVSHYQKLQSLGQDGCLGGSTWGYHITTISSWFKREYEWYDSWAVPEMTGAKFGKVPDALLGRRVPFSGLVPTSSLMCCAIFPRRQWDNGARFRADPVLRGCEVNGFWEGVSIPKYTDLNVIFWRHTVYSFTKCLRVSLHLGRFVGKKPLVMGSNPDVLQKYKKWKL